MAQGCAINSSGSFSGHLRAILAVIGAMPYASSVLSIRALCWRRLLSLHANIEITQTLPGLISDSVNSGGSIAAIVCASDAGNHLFCALPALLPPSVSPMRKVLPIPGESPIESGNSIMMEVLHLVLISHVLTAQV